MIYSSVTPFRSVDRTALGEFSEMPCARNPSLLHTETPVYSEIECLVREGLTEDGKRRYNKTCSCALHGEFGVRTHVSIVLPNVCAPAGFLRPSSPNLYH